MFDNFGPAVTRLTAIDWHFDERRVQSHVALLREFLRRMLVAGRAVGLVERWPFFDLAGSIVQAPVVPAGISESVLASIPRYLNENVKWTCLWYLRIKAVRSDALLEAGLSGNEYDPLITMYERGGYFSQETRQLIDIPPFTVSIAEMHHYDSAVPFVDLSCEVLDALDS